MPLIGASTWENQSSEKSEKACESAKVADVEDGSETALTVRPSTALLTSSTWVLDLGATSHMTSNSNYFTRIHKKGDMSKLEMAPELKLKGLEMLG